MQNISLRLWVSLSVKLWSRKCRYQHFSHSKNRCRLHLNINKAKLQYWFIITLILYVTGLLSILFVMISQNCFLTENSIHYKKSSWQKHAFHFRSFSISGLMPMHNYKIKRTHSGQERSIFFHGNLSNNKTFLADELFFVIVHNY